VNATWLLIASNASFA
jgi:hypothetical protein